MVIVRLIVRDIGYFLVFLSGTEILIFTCNEDHSCHRDQYRPNKVQLPRNIPGLIQSAAKLTSDEIHVPRNRRPLPGNQVPA